MELTNDTTVSVNPFDAFASWEFLRHILSDVLPKTWIILSGMVYVIAEVLVWTFAKRSVFLEFMKWICYVGEAKAPKLKSVTENAESNVAILNCEFSEQHSYLSRIFPLIKEDAVVYLTNHNIEKRGDWKLERTNYNCHLHLGHVQDLSIINATIRVQAKYGNILFGSREEAHVFSPQSNEIQHAFLCNIPSPEVTVFERQGRGLPYKEIKLKIPREAERLYIKVTRCIIKRNEVQEETLQNIPPNTNTHHTCFDTAEISRGEDVRYKVGFYLDEKDEKPFRETNTGVDVEAQVRIGPETQLSNGAKPTVTDVLNDQVKKHSKNLRSINNNRRSVRGFRDCEIVMSVICQTYEAFTELREMCSDGRVSEILSDIVTNEEASKSLNLPNLKLDVYMKYSSYLDARKNFARAACGSMPQLEARRHTIVAGTVIEWNFATQVPYLQWRHLHCKVQGRISDELERGQWIDIVSYKLGEMGDSDIQIYFDQSRNQCCSYRIGASFDGKKWYFSNFIGEEVEVQVSMSGSEANVDYLKPVLKDIIDISRLEKRNLCRRGDNISTAIDCLEDGTRYVEDVRIENSDIILTVVCDSEKSVEEVVDLCCRGSVAVDLSGVLEREEDIDRTAGVTFEDVKLTVESIMKPRQAPEFTRNVIIKTIHPFRLHEALNLETSVPKKIGKIERVKDREVHASKFRSKSCVDFSKPIVPDITDDEQCSLESS
ncbi:uncharacterized protein LOC106168743 isoform X2 [Lingula anatina]|uniref:Uncharacterized protein LOC106168743 isoform X2 n=1 Tax=Lingula anatina TaxID=7574 RepID=A0A1S3IYT8_LINAN|nr:uncharacterized protein LOC106168743 isoform X2 [Lingula anatina]|eukprot:XP_013403367.1 uncharacterized protein LOC106168743 isoform X2 [Lingula anatina]